MSLCLLCITCLPHPSAKVTTVNKHGDTALDVAKNWGDDFIYATMYAKMASLPCPPEKKGKPIRTGGGGGGRGEATDQSVNIRTETEKKACLLKNFFLQYFTEIFSCVFAPNISEKPCIVVRIIICSCRRRSSIASL